MKDLKKGRRKGCRIIVMWQWYGNFSKRKYCCTSDRQSVTRWKHHCCEHAAAKHHCFFCRRYHELRHHKASWV